MCSSVSQIDCAPGSGCASASAAVTPLRIVLLYEPYQGSPFHTVNNFWLRLARTLMFGSSTSR